MNGIGATATSVSGTLTLSMIAERDDEAHEAEAHDRHEREEQLHRADVAVGARDELARLHAVVERERQRGEVLVDRGAQVVLERVGRLEQRRPVDEGQPAAQRGRAPTARPRTAPGCEVRSVSAWSIAPISTRGARICASIATAAADRPNASCRRARQQHGQHATDPPEVAVGGERGGRRRRGRLVGERRLVRARRNRRGRRGRGRARSRGSRSTPLRGEGGRRLHTGTTPTTTLSHACSGSPHDRRGDVALVVAAICFGSTFIAVQGAVEQRGADPVPRRPLPHRRRRPLADRPPAARPAPRAARRDARPVPPCCSATSCRRPASSTRARPRPRSSPTCWSCSCRSSGSSSSVGGRTR